ncbi:hypothetical protein IF1G_11294 [Cordyceps javanica]|uniref:Uncharacterized protein n=1 Tax=Cordyceps javanica TaxID=43265 RepID=A0A545UKP9_9HYPO|nr:hypothetical protein IF1G_11294 [Cordyceps javanica]
MIPWYLAWLHDPSLTDISKLLTSACPFTPPRTQADAFMTQGIRRTLQYT